MKLKYYLRGLGAGILFSVLIFVFVVSPKESKISDDEIIQRAKQLGMTEKKEINIDMEKLRENNTPSPATDNTETLSPSPTSILTPDPETTTVPTPTPTMPPTPTLAPTLKPTNSPTPTLTPTPTSSPIKVPTPSTAPTQVPEEGSDENEAVSAVVEIKSGMRSEDICAVIEKAGLIKDAMSLNAYLIQNGYAERLRSGKFELNSKMTFQEIAKMLTW